MLQSSAVNIACYNVAVIAHVTETFNSFGRGQRASFIFRMIDDQSVEMITGLQRAYLAKDASSNLGGAIEGIGKGNGGTLRWFVEFF